MPTLDKSELVLGVTGHRVLAEIAKIEAGVAAALERIRAQWPKHRFTLLSSLAEGADCLVARCVLAWADSYLIVPLPLPPADSLADCGTAEAQREFLALLARAQTVIELPAAEMRNVAYEAAGLYVLDHCEILITIWDGGTEQGQGGTGGIVARARERCLPIAWVHAGNRKPDTFEPTSLGLEQGRVTFENF